MDLKYLNTVKAILETGSYQNAAQKLSYTQSTVTFQMQQLEQALSVKIFEKIGRKMVLTQGGRDVLPYIDTILESVEQLMNHGKESHKLSGTLRVAMPETLLTYKMQPLLKSFREKAPNVCLSLQSHNCYGIRDKISNGGVDIAVHYDVGGYRSTISTKPLATFPLALIAAPSLPASEQNFLSTHQAKPLCLIYSDRESISQQRFDQFLKQKDIIFDTTMELGSVESIKRSVASNLGVACLPRFSVEDELKSGTLIELAMDMSNPCVTVLCAYHKNKWISPAMELFITLTKENMPGAVP